MTTQLAILFCVVALSYVAYANTVFYYAELIFEKRTDKYKLLKFAFILIDAGYVLTVILPGTFLTDIICMLLYCVVVLIEGYLLYKISWKEALFGVLCFASNFFSVRFLVLTFISIITKSPMHEILADMEMQLILMIIALLIPVPYVFLFKKLIRVAVIKRTLATKVNLKISTFILLLVYINLICSVATIYAPVLNVSISVLYLMISAIVPIIIFLVMIYVLHLYSNLNDVAEEFEDIIFDISNTQKTVSEMEQYTEIDYMTGCFVRSVATDTIKTYLEEKIAFSIIYIDLDGLKTVNDKYGHEEGDWYIKTVSDKIRSIFDGEVIARIGGDEFLVVSKNFAKTQAQTCVIEVEQLAAKNNKQYVTSVSIGVQDTAADTILGVETLIAKADEKMYEMKCKKNKQRRI